MDRLLSALLAGAGAAVAGIVVNVISADVQDALPRWGVRLARWADRLRRDSNYEAGATHRRDGSLRQERSRVGAFVYGLVVFVWALVDIHIVRRWLAISVVLSAAWGTGPLFPIVRDMSGPVPAAIAVAAYFVLMLQLSKVLGSVSAPSTSATRRLLRTLPVLAFNFFHSYLMAWSWLILIFERELQEQALERGLIPGMLTYIELVQDDSRYNESFVLLLAVVALLISAPGIYRVTHGDVHEQR